jgi:hypothetical protein
MNARIPTTPAATQAPGVAALVLPAMNEHLIMILGRADFACTFTAKRLRELGHKINRNPQEEQAAVIHFNLGMYLQHGAAWFQHASAYLDNEPQVSTPGKAKVPA